jgi:DNA replication protein DnaC
MQKQKEEVIMSSEANENPAWLAFCPKLYRNTNVRKLRAPIVMIKRVISHPICERGLRIVGPTGIGKTRLAYMMLKRFYLDGVSMKTFDSTEFGSQASAAFRDGRERDFFKMMVEPEVLFLDDLGKNKNTERVIEALFTVVDRRGARQKPILFTMQYNLKMLRRRLERDEIDDAMIDGLIRRMDEYCDLLQLGTLG